MVTEISLYYDSRSEKHQTSIYIENCVRFINNDYKYCSLNVYVIFTRILEISAEETKFIVLYIRASIEGQYMPHIKLHLLDITLTVVQPRSSDF